MCVCKGCPLIGEVGGGWPLISPLYGGPLETFLTHTCRHTPHTHILPYPHKHNKTQIQATYFMVVGSAHQSLVSWLWPSPLCLIPALIFLSHSALVRRTSTRSGSFISCSRPLKRSHSAPVSAIPPLGVTNDSHTHTRLLYQQGTIGFQPSGDLYFWSFKKKK